MNKLRKFLVVGVMVLSVIAMSGLPMTSVQAAASAGDLIKMDGLSSVYYLGNDGKRYVFPNESTYFSWYADFSGVVTIPASELQSYPLGGNVTMRPGTTLVKITTDPSVYAVEPNGVLRKIQNESQAAALYGTNWNKRIVDLSDAFFTNYTIGTPLADGQIPVGSLVKNANNATVYYYDGSNYRAVSSEAALSANRLWLKYVLTVTNTLTSGGSALSGMETALVNTAQNGGTGTVITGSGLMVSLNSTTPASMNIPGNVSVEMLKINLTAANDGPVNVSAITLTAHGLSNADNINEVTIFDNGVKVGSSKNVNSNREAAFNFATPIYVAAGTTKTLSVKATIASTSGSYGLGIASASHIISSGATVSGSFPVNGNLMSAIVASVGQITATDTDVSDSVSFGEDNVLLADFTLALDNQENALVQSISLYNGGTNDNNIVSNLVLIIDGEQAATGSYLDRYATFTLNNYEIEKGDTVSVEVRGDMGITSSGDTVKFYLKDAVDFVAVGKTHGFGLGLSNDFNAVLSSVALTTGDFTIDMDKSATPAKDVKPGDDDVVLATLKMTSNGENATLSAITAANFYVTLGTGSTTILLENVEMRDVATGGIYDLTIATSSATKHTLALSDEITLVKGVTKTFQVRADILDAAPVNETFKVTLEGTGMAIEGDVSGADINDITPSSVTGSIITVKNATLALTPTVLVDTSIVGGASDVIVYQGKVKAGTADDVRLQSVKLTSATTTLVNSAFTDSNVSKLSLWLNGKLLKEVSNAISGDSITTNGTITFSSLNTANYTIPAGMEYDLVVKADFASSLTAGDFKLAADAVNWIARSVDGNEIVSMGAATTASRKVTVAAKGTLAVSLVTTDSKASRDSYILAGSSSEAGRYLGEIKFVTTKEAVKVETLALTATSSATASNDDIASIKLVTAAGVVVASESVDANGDVTFDPFNVIFDADKSTSLFIVVEAKGINVDGDAAATADHGDFIVYELGAVEAMGNVSGETLAISDGLTNSGGVSKTATIVGSKLVSVVNSMSDGTLTGGTGKILGKYTLVFDNGSNRDTSNEALKAALSEIEITFSNTATVTAPYLYIEGYSSNAATSTGTVLGASKTWTGNLANLVDGGEIDGTVTLVVAGEVTTSGENQYVQTSLTSLGDDIEYTVDSATVSPMLINVNSVDGATLSN